MRADAAARFARVLAKYVAEDQATKSIELSMGKESAKMWAEMRSCTPVRGYPTVEEAEKTLLMWLLS